jgi:hypothetical protein
MPGACFHDYELFCVFYISCEGMSTVNHESCCRTVGDVLTHTLVSALEDREAELDEEIKRLENLDENDLEEIRQKRLEQMQESFKKTQEYIQAGHGEYTELHSEKEFFEVAKKSKHLVCHFYRPSTWRCQIMDKHCEALAKIHIECRFVKINIEKSPYLAEKLRIVMLPTVMLVKDGKTDHSIIGFDEMGGTDNFETDDFANVLSNWGAIHRQSG